MKNSFPFFLKDDLMGGVPARSPFAGDGVLRDDLYAADQQFKSAADRASNDTERTQERAPND